jgi:hypothetical protein
MRLAGTFKWLHDLVFIRELLNVTDQRESKNLIGQTYNQPVIQFKRKHDKPKVNYDFPQ